MRIRELLEGKHVDDFSEFVEKDNDKGGINFDLVEDLVFFMHNNDDAYRRHVYPSIAKCVEHSKSKKDINPAMFKNAALESYNRYVTEFPMRELPNSLDNATLKQVCVKMKEDFNTHFNDGKYKD